MIRTRTSIPLIVIKRSFETRGAAGVAAPRTPLIKFVGKRDHTAAEHHHQPVANAQQMKSAVPIAPPKQTLPVTTATPASKSGKFVFQPKPRKPHTPTAVEYYEIKGGVWHGRHKLTVDEVEAINMGGYMA